MLPFFIIILIVFFLLFLYFEFEYLLQMILFVAYLLKILFLKLFLIGIEDAEM